MFSKYLKRASIKSAAAGSVLAVAAAATPAVVTVAPQIATMACGSYAAPTTTGTELALSRNMGKFGQLVRAWARTNGQGNPQGRVTFSVNGDVFAAVSSERAADGLAVPRLGAGDTYTIRARFTPDCEGQYDYRPSSDSASLTVFKADTSTSADAGDRRRGGTAVVRGVVDSDTRVEPGGSVRVTISNGDASRTRTVLVEQNTDSTSSYRAAFRKVGKPGAWSVVSRYLGTANFDSSTGRTSFKVRR